MLRIREAKQEIMDNNNVPINDYNNIRDQEHTIVDMSGYEKAEEAKVAKEETEEWNIRKVIELLLFLTIKS